MSNRRRLLPTIIATALAALFLPLIASAQGGSDLWGRNGRDNRLVRETARRLDDRSGDFQRHLDMALDHSRHDGTFREDRINEAAREFRFAASAFKRSVNFDGRNLDRSYDEARRLLQLGSRLDGFVSRQRLDFRTERDWAQIRQDLRLIANVYHLDFNGGGWRR